MSAYRLFRLLMVGFYIIGICDVYDSWNRLVSLGTKRNMLTPVASIWTIRVYDVFACCTRLDVLATSAI